MVEKMTRTCENESVQALLILEGDEARQFTRLKERRGVKNNVELLRILVKEAVTLELKEVEP